MSALTKVIHDGVVVPDICVLYHGNCFDGFGSAYAAWKRFGDTALYIPMGYGDPIPKECYEAREVYLLDYSRKRSELVDLVEKSGCRLTVIDHHKTAQAELVNMDEYGYVLFDMGKSGALMSWEYFHPRIEAPTVIQHIQDRDLWKFKIPGTKQVHAALCSYHFDFKAWDEIIQQCFLVYNDPDIASGDYQALLHRGDIVLDYHSVLIEQYCAQADLVQIGGHTVPLVNLSLLFSEVPHRLLEIYPQALFSAYVYHKKGGIAQYGLRTRDTGTFDVTDIAKIYGGRGHKNAAGFELKGDDIYDRSYLATGIRQKDLKKL